MPSKPHLTLFLVGLALSIAQFLMIRDFVTILYGEEIVIVLVTSSFFLGLSVGYALSLRLSDRAFRALFVTAVFLHLTFPLSYRYLAASLAAARLSGPVWIALLFVYALLFNSVFAAFLPRLISRDETGGGGQQRLRVYYALELAGFMAGFGVVVASWNRPSWLLMLPYWAVLGVLLHRVLRRPALTGAYAACGLVAALGLARLDHHATAWLYETQHGVDGARVLYSVNSPYQRVDVIEDDDGDRYLYLDGLLNLNSGDLDALNYYIATLPARLIRPQHTLLIGNGTLSSVPRVMPFSERVTSVELDGGVLEAGRRFFTPDETLADFPEWTLHVDDGKRFLADTAERFDLVVVDVPSPLTIQEGYLHTVEFYTLVRERLTERGVIAVQLSGRLRRNDRTPARVTAALRAVFPEVLAIYSDRADRGFAYASRALPFTGAELRAAARGFESRIVLVTPDRIDDFLELAEPLSLDRLDLVLKRGFERFRARYLQ